MSFERSPLAYRYQEALAPLTRLSSDPRLGKRLSEILALLDFNTTLNLSMSLSEILDLVLLVSLGETGASWAAVLLAEGEQLKPAAQRGRSAAFGALAVSGADRIETTAAPEDADLSPDTGELLLRSGAGLAVSLRKGEKLIGALLLGPRRDARPYDSGERSFAEALAISAAAGIDNGRIYEELERLNRRLSFKVFQLDSLFDITRELHRALDARRVREIVLTSAMGHLLATRCALVGPDGLVDARGLRFTAEELARLTELAALTEEKRPGELQDGGFLAAQGFEIVVPLRAYGALLVGKKASGELLGEEDADFLRSLAAQAAAALDNLRLTAEWIEKQKIDKEMALAREIQRGLLPDRDPSLPGWDVAGVNIPSLSVGGDYYDYLEGPGGRLGIAIADVSGKGTGPALLMASVQAALRALASLGDLPLAEMLSRLNRQIHRSSLASKYVTMFFGSLDPGRGDLSYVNAGHPYPLLFRRGGAIERLVTGSPVIGLLPEVAPEVGRIRLEPGDMLVAYTDGLSETRDPSGAEFQEERIIATARAVERSPARDVVARLVSGVRIFAAGAGLGDDLTLVVVKRL